MKDSAISYIVDVGPIVGLLSETDQWHAWSHSVLTSLDDVVDTTETVWAEVCHHLKRDRRSLFAAVESVDQGRIVLHAGWKEPARIITLLERYPQMDAGDASLVVLSEQFPKAKIITTDVRDFGIYRRFRNQPLPLIHP